MTSFEFKITDGAGNNSHTFHVTRWDFNDNRQLKYFPFVSTAAQTTITTGIIFDFGRKVEGFVLYGVIPGGYSEVMAIRTLINEEWWNHRPAKLYLESGSSHSGQVADFKCYCDRNLGGEANIKFTLVFTVGEEKDKDWPWG